MWVTCRAVVAVAVLALAASARGEAQSSGGLVVVAREDSVVPIQELPAGDRPAVIRNSCRYVIVPAARAGEPLTGEVSLAFVITAAGRVDSSSIDVLDATDPFWVAYARRDLLSCRFRPGRRDGKAVAVMSAQRYPFVRVRARGR